MSIHTTTSTFDDSRDLPTDDALGRVYEDARRRTLLEALTRYDGAVELDELTARVVAEERSDPGGGTDPGTGDGYADRALVSLYHCHLPVLANAGLVEVEEGDGVVVRPNAEALADLS